MERAIKLTDLSPLRYPGSKKSLVPFVYRLLSHNGLLRPVLVEPFAGSANVSLHLLANKAVSRVILADIDPLIYSFWNVVFTQHQKLTRFIGRVRIDEDNFYRFKEIARSTGDVCEVELAKACLFLNRTSFSGLLTDKAGPIGGKEQKSEYKIDCRFNREKLISRIKTVAALSEKVTVLPLGWRDTLSYVLSLCKAKKKAESMFFYLDPPFFDKAESLYRFWFREQEHRALYKAVSKLKHPWLLSYDDAPQIRRMYTGNCVKVNVSMPYSVNSNAQRRARELVITPLRIPPM
ncbi:MAG: DNA adenine methylase [Candidatus Zixiibacteriota bacterium]